MPNQPRPLRSSVLLGFGLLFASASLCLTGFGLEL
jgi:hypothetical protein